MDLNKFNNGNGIFIQIGAGAGDLDKRANCRDGFTEIIKSLPRHMIKKIILVEPNPLNIPLLHLFSFQTPIIYNDNSDI